MKHILFPALLILSIFLSACGGESEPIVQANDEAITEVRVVESGSEPEKVPVGISEDYEDALSLAGQLAIGTVQLEQGELGVDENQAESLLPLWQAYQSLIGSDATAKAELTAVLKQIQGTLTDAQVESIAAMRLDSESLAKLMEEGLITLGRGGFGAAGRLGQEAGGSPGGFQGGMRGQGFGQGPGGGPDGGIAGMEIPGNLDQDALATRQAQFTEGDLADVQDRMLVTAVIRYLQEKTGDLPENEGVFVTLLEVVSGELGVAVDDLQSQTAEGKTLAQIVDEYGGDVESILEKTLEEMESSDQFMGENLEEFLRSILE